MHSYISSPANTARILNKYGIKLKKSLGQNFLIDTNSAKKIVRCAAVNSDDTVLEIGSGIGGLTEILMDKAKKAVCIELDRLIIKAFKDIFGRSLKDKARLELIEADALKLDYHKIADKYGINKVVSNLPYSIAAPLLLRILLQAESAGKMVLTIQKDIAERILASTGDSNYSSYTVKANILADFNFCFQISRNCFIPRPFVDSSVIEVTGKDRRFLSEYGFDIKNFFKFIDSCFLHRRKKLINSLVQNSPAYCHKIELIIKLLTEMGKDKNVRAEELSFKDYICLYRNLISNK